MVTGAATDLSIREAFRFAWGAYRKQAPYFIAMLVGMVGAWGLLETLVIGFQMPPGRIDHVVLHIAFFWALAFFDAAISRLALDMHDDEPLSMARMAPKAGVTTTLFAARMMFLPLVIVALAALVIPGLYVIARWGFIPFAVVDHPSTPLGAWRESSCISAGVRGRLVLLAGGLLLFNMVGATLLGLGLLVTVPMTYLVLAFVYRQLGARSTS